jgi:hypothetical protein
MPRCHGNTSLNSFLDWHTLSTVMPGLVPGIHVLAQKKDVDGRDKPGHDEESALFTIVAALRNL